jgi:hypothetical protein
MHRSKTRSHNNTIAAGEGIHLTFTGRGFWGRKQTNRARRKGGEGGRGDLTFPSCLHERKRKAGEERDSGWPCKGTS